MLDLKETSDGFLIHPDSERFDIDNYAVIFSNLKKKSIRAYLKADKILIRDIETNSELVHKLALERVKMDLYNGQYKLFQGDILQCLNNNIIEFFQVVYSDNNQAKLKEISSKLITINGKKNVIPLIGAFSNFSVEKEVTLQDHSWVSGSLVFEKSEYQLLAIEGVSKQLKIYKPVCLDHSIN